MKEGLHGEAFVLTLLLLGKKKFKTD